MSAALIAAMSWFWNNVPWYAALGAFLIATYIILGIVHRIQLIRTASKFDPTEYKQLGRDMVGLSTEISRFLADRQRDKTELPRRNRVEGDGDGLSQWQDDRDFEAVTGRIFFEKFGPQVLGSLALLQRVGVELPTHMVYLTKSRPDGVLQFLAVIGDILSRGFIDEAVETSKNRDFMWEIQS